MGTVIIFDASWVAFSARVPPEENAVDDDELTEETVVVPLLLPVLLIFQDRDPHTLNNRHSMIQHRK